MTSVYKETHFYNRIVKWLLLVFLGIVVRFILNWIPQVNNVCSDLSHYTDINNNGNCWYNSDLGLSVVELGSKYGYYVEEHFVTSEDGYILYVVRIGPKNNKTIEQPLLLIPGMGATPEIWAMQGSRSLAFLLADNGYDVWLAATRGTSDLKKEENYLASAATYWDFSFHEIGIYDVPALTDYVVSKSNNKKIIYIGHSMSTTASFIYASEKAEHARKNLKGIISLAPTVYMRHVQGFFKLIGPKNNWIHPLAKMLGWNAFGETLLARKLVSIFCRQYPGVFGCYHFYAYASGHSPTEKRTDLVPIFFHHMPTAISLKILAHFGQLIETGRFQKFDYRDEQVNLLKYNSTIPPEYNISKITIPVHVFVGKYDYNAPEEDVDIFYQELKKNRIPSSKHVFDYAHTDFFLGRNNEDFHKTLLVTLNELFLVPVVTEV